MVTGKGQLIKLLRLLSGVSQDSLAELLGIAQRNIAMIEAARFEPRSDFAHSIAHIFFISPQYYQLKTGPVFTQNVVFFVDKKWMPRNNKDILTINTLLHQFIEEHKIKKAYLINKCVLAFNVGPQYMFFYSDEAESYALSFKKSLISIKNISLDVVLTEDDIEKRIGFLFPKERASRFIKSFFSVVDTKFVFNPDDFKKQIEGSKKFIIDKTKGNKIKEIRKIMKFFGISLKDIK